MENEVNKVIEKLNREKEALRAFEQVVKDTMYVFPYLSEDKASQAAVTFIQYPKMLLELNGLVNDKRKSDENQ